MSVGNLDAVAVDLEAMGFQPGSYTLSGIGRLRKIIAGRMTEAARDVPHFALNADLRLDRLIALRAQHNARAPEARISINDLVVKASALALVKMPEVNASYRPEAIVMHHGADIAVVVAIPGGLVTPIVRNAQAKAIVEIAAELRALTARAQSMSLKPEEYVGGTFTISNLGMYGVASFGSIINQPQGAILSVGAGRQVVIPGGDGMEVATMMTTTLTCDHRVIDGVAGARWLEALRAAIEAPECLFGL